MDACIPRIEGKSVYQVHINNCNSIPTESLIHFNTHTTLDGVKINKGTTGESSLP